MTVRVFTGSGSADPVVNPLGAFVQSVLEALGAGDLYVEAWILETKAALREALMNQLRDVPAVSGIAIPDFATFHESFGGYPRIWVSKSGMNIAEPVSRARLEHEAGHAALHWEISSYLIRTSPPLLGLARERLLTQQEADLASYLLLIAIKDHQVSSLLARSPYKTDQIAFYSLELSVKPRVATIFDALGELKLILAARPFRRSRRVSKLLGASLVALGRYRGMAEAIIFDLEHHPGEGLESLLELASERVVSMIGGGTHGTRD